MKRREDLLKPRIHLRVLYKVAILPIWKTILDFFASITTSWLRELERSCPRFKAS